MAQPKRKHTRSRTRVRRASNWKIQREPTSICTNCSEPRPPHRICPKCGFYKGRLVLAPKVKKKDEKKEEGK